MFYSCKVSDLTMSHNNTFTTCCMYVRVRVVLYIFYRFTHFGDYSTQMALQK